MAMKYPPDWVNIAPPLEGLDSNSSRHALQAAAVQQRDLVSTSFNTNILNKALEAPARPNEVMPSSKTGTLAWEYTLPGSNNAPIEPCPPRSQILVAEDNLMVRASLAHLFDQWGISYTMCKDGEEAWEMLCEEAYDLALIDLQMPRMDGFQLKAHLDKHPDNPNACIPFIAFSANIEGAAKEHCTLNGFNELLSKPLDLAALYKVLFQYLQVPFFHWAKPMPFAINSSELYEAYSHDYAHLYQLFSIFLRNTPLSLSLIEDALEHRDWQKVEQEIHKVKPTFAMIGLEKITQMAHFLERQLQEPTQKTTYVLQEFHFFQQSVEQALVLVEQEQQKLQQLF